MRGILLGLFSLSLCACSVPFKQGPTSKAEVGSLAGASSKKRGIFATSGTATISLSGSRIAGRSRPGSEVLPNYRVELDQILNATAASGSDSSVRVAQLDPSRQIALSNHPEVNQLIDRWTSDQRQYIRGALESGKPYHDDFKRVFAELNLPTELVHLAYIESGFSPNARSPKRAVGMWQFTADTARHCGLMVNHKQDERRDAMKSTRAAAKYLAELYGQFGDWHLALAAYNGGPARVERIIQEQGTRNFFELSRKGVFPTETKNFVPKFLALTKIMNNLEFFGFEVPAAAPGSNIIGSASASDSLGRRVRRIPGKS